MKHRIVNLIGFVVIFCCMVFSSCDKEEVNKPIITTQLSTDIKDLYVEKGNLKSDKVMLYCNGGPENVLRLDYFDDLELSDYHEVYVHQSNTYNLDIIQGLNENLSFERAIQEDLVSVEILYRVAKYFKQKGKKVYIIGHSFGAVLIPKLIADKENLVEKYLIMAGRLDFPDVVWKGFRDRRGYYFKDGVVPTRQDFSEVDVTEKEKKEMYAVMRLQAGFGMYRYTKLLKDKDLSNVIYAFGDKDEAVGGLTDAEVVLLRKNNATVYEIKGGGHGSMLDPVHKENIKKLLLK
ncbi:alpha/beta hydrolase (plasmid) [Flammeovirga sp. MY04]|uniref:alpha/beta hydrolase n=1 Tax=Flammeovirga sp. MY04 TaxID=1191459 RepID=UPI000825B05E|nr:alpha/beta hydrolase [Flammeovirga sp. MY04]ANQ52886.2 alpha/beta hydrolase [Flammeovirga sp. MY04]